MSAKRMNEIRETVVESAKVLEVKGFEFVGRSSEGLVFENASTDEYFVVKVIVKKEGFDAIEAIEEYEEKQEIAREKAEKAEAKKATVKAKKEATEKKAEEVKAKREQVKESTVEEE